MDRASEYIVQGLMVPTLITRLPVFISAVFAAFSILPFWSQVLTVVASNSRSFALYSKIGFQVKNRVVEAFSISVGMHLGLVSGLASSSHSCAPVFGPAWERIFLVHVSRLGVETPESTIRRYWGINATAFFHAVGQPASWPVSSSRKVCVHLPTCVHLTATL